MLLVLALAVLPLLAAAVPLLYRWLGRNTGYPLAVGFLVMAVLLAFAAPWSPGDRPATVSVDWLPALQVSFALRLDGLALLFALLILGVGALVLAYCASYLEPHGRHALIYLLLTLFAGAMLGLVLADDIILLVVFWELTTICSFFLITDAGPHAARPATRAFLVTAAGGLALLAAAVLLAIAAGTTRLSAILADSASVLDSPLARPAGVLLVLAAFTKSAQFPFHSWLPGAMVAITPVSAYLHAATMVKAGIYLLIRFSGLYGGQPGWDAALVISGLFTAVLGAVWALRQHDLKRLLAYSTISQLGLLVAAIGVGTPVALAAAVLHTIAHALFKATLFMLVGIIDREAGSRDIRELPGLRQVMPVSAAMTGLAALSLAGVPPLIGFVSKESLFQSYLEAGHTALTGAVTAVVAVGASALTFAYGARIVTGAFGGRPVQAQLHEPHYAFLLPPATAALAGLVLGPGVPLLDVPVGQAVQAVFPDAPVPHYKFWHGLSPELGLSALAIGTGLVLTLRAGRVERAMQRLPGPQDWFRPGYETLVRFGSVVGHPDHADRPGPFLARPVALVTLLAAAAWAAGGFPLPSGPPSAGREWPLLALLAVAVATAAAARSALAALALTGTAGLLVSVWFLQAGAPDVALTVLLVEVLTAVAAVSVLPALPPRFRRPGAAAAGGRRTRAGPRIGTGAAAGIALAAGAAAALGVLALTGRPEISEPGQTLLSRSEPETGGHNVVNTILVEFRALDTLGETMVLASVALGLSALLLIRPWHAAPDAAAGPDATAAADAADRTTDGPGRDVPGRVVPGRDSLVFRMAHRLLAPVMVLVALWLLLRGHNHPGGGFIAALVAGCAPALGVLAYRGPPGLPGRLLEPVRLVSAGTLLALVTALAPLATGKPFFTPLHLTVHLPAAGGLKLTSSLLFDFAVLLVVTGLVSAALTRLRSGTAPPDTWAALSRRARRERRADTRRTAGGGKEGNG
ncbi:hydrogen gas-evolving membrane-bound hydrogenase subunit E [Streptomyces aidingensis]|uniref:Multicomponent Na+:H+ antiporter subunit A n=1 Tax=Streptomyces aidingensis TaxID=910347 RepID=A0A1I1FW97_9ACTN|nr:hydrogen gas-evolving membrane-bound hydrogenase subunit E [Streptomyces aidingensis]SFC03302.1 multicomponent Na+:H+ antiporter subunit A [Streptomyces aidingensis]